MATEIVFSCKTYSNNLYQVNRFLSIPLITSCSSKSAHVLLLSLSLVIEESIIFFNCKWIIYLNQYLQPCSESLALLFGLWSSRPSLSACVRVLGHEDRDPDSCGSIPVPGAAKRSLRTLPTTDLLQMSKKQKSPTKNLRILQQRDYIRENKTFLHAFPVTFHWNYDYDYDYVVFKHVCCYLFCHCGTQQER